MIVSSIKTSETIAKHGLPLASTAVSFRWISCRMMKRKTAKFSNSRLNYVLPEDRVVVFCYTTAVVPLSHPHYKDYPVTKIIYEPFRNFYHEGNNDHRHRNAIYVKNPPPSLHATSECLYVVFSKNIIPALINDSN